MKNSPSLVRPMIGKKIPELGKHALLVATHGDMEFVLNELGVDRRKSFPLYMSRLHVHEFGDNMLTILGPLMGAPYGVILFETLIAWGVRHLLFFGWCGSIAENLRIGDVLFPQCGHIDEGTSRHYGQKDSIVLSPDTLLSDSLKALVKEQKLSYKEGAVWSTDALFRETQDQISCYQRKKADAVDMETSALFSVARFYEVSMDTVLMVSDELFTGEWVKGFNRKIFKQNRKQILRQIVERLRGL